MRQPPGTVIYVMNFLKTFGHEKMSPVIFKLHGYIARGDFSKSEREREVSVAVHIIMLYSF